MNNKRILLAESSSLLSRWQLSEYQDVYTLDGDFPNTHRLPNDFMMLTDKILSNYKAGTIIDWVYVQYIKSKEDKIFNEVMEDERGSLFIKKTILWELGKVIYSFILAEKFENEYGHGHTVDFIPLPFSYSLYQLISTRKELLPRNVNIPQWYLNKMRRLELMKSWIHKMALIFYPLWISLFMWGPRLEDKAKKNYRYGIHMWDSWINTSNPPHRMEYFEGKNCVNPNNTLQYIVTKITKKNLRKVKTNGYDCCHFKEMVRLYNVKEYLDKVYPSARKIAKKMLSMKSGKALLTESYIRTLRLYVLWKIFFSRYSVDTFLFAQDSGDIPGALLQKAHGSKNIFFYYSTQYDCVYKESMNTFTEIYYGYMIFTAVISSKISNGYFKKNNNYIDRYENCGVVWSDLVFALKYDLHAQEKIKQELGIPRGKFILGYFAPGMGRAGFISEEEAYKTVHDIYRLLDSDDEYFMVLKYRYRERLTKNSAIAKQFDQLIKHDRVIDANVVAPHYRAYNLMGMCDLVIGGFASSVPMESVVGGIRSMCYLPQERLHKNAFVINTFPRFCAYNYKQLTEYARYWLNECTDEDFVDFQNAYIKKHVDEFCDGQAAQRLRAFLDKLSREEGEGYSRSRDVTLLQALESPE